MPSEASTPRRASPLMLFEPSVPLRASPLMLVEPSMARRASALMPSEASAPRRASPLMLFGPPMARRASPLILAEPSAARWPSSLTPSRWIDPTGRAVGKSRHSGRAAGARGGIAGRLGRAARSSWRRWGEVRGPLCAHGLSVRGVEQAVIMGGAQGSPRASGLHDSLPRLAPGATSPGTPLRGFRQRVNLPGSCHSTQVALDVEAIEPSDTTLMAGPEFVESLEEASLLCSAGREGGGPTPGAAQCAGRTIRACSTPCARGEGIIWGRGTCRR